MHNYIYSLDPETDKDYDLGKFDPSQKLLSAILLRGIENLGFDIEARHRWEDDGGAVHPDDPHVHNRFSFSYLKGQVE